MNNILPFVKYVDKHLTRKGFKLEVINEKYIDTGDGMPCAGYFSEDEKKIVVALKTREFLAILAHEYGHFLQFVEDEEKYNYYSISYNKAMDWINGIRITKISFHLDNCLELELDCERRVVKMINEFDLGLDVKDYIRRANAYVYFWKFLRFTRKWCNPYNTPSNNENVVRNMPSKFLKNYELTDAIKKLFEDENI